MHRAIIPMLALVGCATGASEDPGFDSGHAITHDAQLLDVSSNEASDVADAYSGDEASSTDAAVIDSSPTIDSGSCTFTGVLATYDLTGEPGNQTSTAATSSTAGVTAGALGRASMLTAVSGSNSINASGWSTGVIDTTRYYSLTLAATSCALNITSIALDTKESSTGPSAASVATSDDGFAAKSSFGTNAATTASLAVSGATGSIEIRIYGFDASSAAGTMRIQNTLTINGALK